VFSQTVFSSISSSHGARSDSFRREETPQTASVPRRLRAAAGGRRHPRRPIRGGGRAEGARAETHFHGEV